MNYFEQKFFRTVILINIMKDFHCKNIMKNFERESFSNKSTLCFYFISSLIHIIEKNVFHNTIIVYINGPQTFLIVHPLISNEK